MAGDDLRQTPPAPDPAQPRKTMTPPTAPAGPRRRSRYSRFVRLSRILLPALGAGLILLVLVWSQLTGVGGDSRIGYSGIIRDDVDALRMVSPRFTGVDGEGKPFRVEADEATQPAVDSPEVTLKVIRADMTASDGTWLAIRAKSGTFNRDDERLELEGQVEVIAETGYAMQTEHVAADLDSGTIRGDHAVVAHGPVGTIDAAGFTVRREHETITFDGPVRVTGYPGVDR